ncbi:phosphoglycerate mutase family protein [candidate division KSB1 bacterium]
MKKLITIITILALFLIISGNCFAQGKLTTVILIRHAEKGTGDDPDLTDKGKKRGAALARLLERTPIAAVYSTKYKRTTQTAADIAKSHDMEIINYNVMNPAQAAGFYNDILDKYSGQNVLVVSHSNIIPIMLDKLKSEFFHTDVSNTSGDILNDDMFVITFDEKILKIVHLKYGEPASGTMH